MSDVLHETTQPEIDKDHVERRLDDWTKRIRALYASVRSWLPHGWSATEARTVAMHEQMMKEVAVPPIDLPVMEISDHGKVKAILEPRGLWIIGANGRIDLLCGDDHYLIVDKAGNFAEPDWQMTNIEDRTRAVPLSRSAFIAALGG